MLARGCLMWITSAGSFIFARPCWLYLLDSVLASPLYGRGLLPILVFEHPRFDSARFKGITQMKHHVGIALLAVISLSTLAAQAPQGWKMRVDRSTEASDPDASGAIKFITMGSGFHATNPQAAVYWN